MIKQAVESVNIKRIVELSYYFSKSSDDAVSTSEELRKENTEEELNKSPILHHNSPSSDYYIELELNNNGYLEDQKFNSMPQRGDTDTYSVNVNQDKDMLLGSEAECSEKL